MCRCSTSVNMPRRSVVLALVVLVLVLVVLIVVVAGGFVWLVQSPKMEPGAIGNGQDLSGGMKTERNNGEFQSDHL
jgi:flagellar basal body-associated protein FliL